MRATSLLCRRQQRLEMTSKGERREASEALNLSRAAAPYIFGCVRRIQLFVGSDASYATGKNCESHQLAV